MRAAVLHAVGEPMQLAADDSQMCTSQTWVVDGGWI